MRYPGECNTRRGPVVIDTVGAAVSAGVGAASFGLAALIHSQSGNDVVPTWDPNRGGSDNSRETLVGLGIAGVVTAAVFAYSAHTGSASVRDCAEARRQLAVGAWQPATPAYAPLPVAPVYAPPVAPPAAPP
ncbi:MAG: hypothetical protein ABUR63_08265 [Verrucomicrobiota bacterium]